MRLLFATYSVVQGSNYRRCHSLARALVQLGAEVTLVAAAAAPSYRSRRHSEDDGVEVIEARGGPSRRIRNAGLDLLELADRLALSHDADVVHTFGHRPTVSLPAARWCRGGRPWVVDWADLWGQGGIADERSLPLKLLLGWSDGVGERRAVCLADAVTTACAELAHRARRLRGACDRVAPDRVLALPPGANVETIRPLPKAEARRRLGLEGAAGVVLYSGMNHGDADLLAETLRCIARSHPGVHFLLLGTPILELERWRRATDRCHFAGFVPYARLAPVLAAADLMLLPLSERTSNLGRFPNRIGDYAAAGRPVLTNPVGDAGRLVADEGFGVVVKPDPEAMASAALGMLADPASLDRLGHRAREVAEERLAWAHRARGALALYRRLVAEKATSRATSRRVATSRMAGQKENP